MIKKTSEGINKNLYNLHGHYIIDIKSCQEFLHFFIQKIADF